MLSVSLFCLVTFRIVASILLITLMIIITRLVCVSVSGLSMAVLRKKSERQRELCIGSGAELCSILHDDIA